MRGDSLDVAAVCMLGGVGLYDARAGATTAVLFVYFGDWWTLALRGGGGAAVVQALWQDLLYGRESGTGAVGGGEGD